MLDTIINVSGLRNQGDTEYCIVVITGSLYIALNRTFNYQCVDYLLLQWFSYVLVPSPVLLQARRHGYWLNHRL